MRLKLMPWEIQKIDTVWRRKQEHDSFSEGCSTVTDREQSGTLMLPTTTMYMYRYQLSSLYFKSSGEQQRVT